MHNLIFSFGVHSETRPSGREEGRQLKKNFFLVPFLGCSRRKETFGVLATSREADYSTKRKREEKLSKGLRFFVCNATYVERISTNVCYASVSRSIAIAS